MPLQEVANGQATAGKTVAPLVDLFVRACVRCGLNGQQSAAAMQMTPAQFSKAFSVNWPEQNPAMKRFDALDYSVRREFAALLAAEYGIEAKDSQQTQRLRDFAHLLREVVA